MTRLTHGKKWTRVYRIWCGIKSRCHNPLAPAFPNYGGRGILLCDRWHKFENFLEDMGEPECGQSIERIDNDRGYEPGNCKWASRLEQNRNKRNNINLTIDGETLCLTEWSERSAIKFGTIWARLQNGWPPKDAVFAPLVKNRKGVPRGKRIHAFGVQHGVQFHDGELQDA